MSSADSALLRVVVADDEQEVRLMLSAQLPDEGISIVGEAADGNEALKACELLQPDAVVLDLLMPNRSGFEVIPILQCRHPEIGIVAYTAVAGDFVRQEMRRMRIPLVLKQGVVKPLADALRDVVGS